MLTYTNIAISAMDTSQISSYDNQHKWHRFLYLYTDGKGHFKSVSQRLKYLEPGVRCEGILVLTFQWTSHVQKLYCKLKWVDCSQLTRCWCWIERKMSPRHINVTGDVSCLLKEKWYCTFVADKTGSPSRTLSLMCHFLPNSFSIRKWFSPDFKWLPGTHHFISIVPLKCTTHRWSHTVH